MASTLGDFHTLIRNTVKRGTTIDDVIPGATARAAKFLEQNYTLQHMKKFVGFNFSTSSAEPRAISLPSTRLKAIEFIRIIVPDVTITTESEDGYHYISKKAPALVTSRGRGMPDFYWISGLSLIWFDKTPLENYAAEMAYAEYTDWPTDTDAAPVLVTDFESVLLWRTLKELTPHIRNKDLQSQIQPNLTEALKTIVDAQDELDNSNSGDNSMAYGVIE